MITIKLLLWKQFFYGTKLNHPVKNSLNFRHPSNEGE